MSRKMLVFIVVGVCAICANILLFYYVRQKLSLARTRMEHQHKPVIMLKKQEQQKLRQPETRNRKPEGGKRNDLLPE